MPELSRFYGIVIKMYFDDHDPSHFHDFDETNVYPAASGLQGAAIARVAVAKDAKCASLKVSSV